MLVSLFNLLVLLDSCSFVSSIYMILHVFVSFATSSVKLTKTRPKLTVSRCLFNILPIYFCLYD